MNTRTIYEQFRADLLAQSAITGVVGQRISFGTVPNVEDLPAITLTPQAAPTDVPYANSSGLSFMAIQVSLFSTSVATNLDLFDFIKGRYNGFSGLLNGNSSALVSKVDVDQMFTYPDSTNSSIRATVFDVNITYNGA